MTTVALTALGFSAVGLPGLEGNEKLFLGMIALAFLALQWAQWGLAGIPGSRSHPALATMLAGCTTYVSTQVTAFSDWSGSDATRTYAFTRTPEQAKMQLIAVPFTPTYAEYIFLKGRRVLADQMQYLLAHFPRTSPLHDRIQRWLG